MKTTKWGVIGLGKIAHKFVQDLQRLPNAEVVAVASTSATRAETFAAQYGIKYFFGDYEALLEVAGLDVVYVATAHTGHCEATLSCLRRGVAVLCEKPLAMNSAEVRQMVATARRHNVFLMEAIWTRFLPTLGEVLQIIEKGELGTLTTLKADFGFRAPFDPQSRIFDPRLGGGSLLDVGIYPVFLSLLLFGKPTVVKAVATLGRSKVDESCAVLLQYEGGKTALLDSSIVTKTDSEACIYGTAGSIKIHHRWHGPNEGFTIQSDNKPPELRQFLWDEGNGYTYEAREVMRCLAEGKTESNLLPLQFSTDLMELMDTIREEAGIFYS